MFARHFGAILSIGLLLAAGTVEAAAPPRDDDVVALVNSVPIYRRSVRAIVQGTILSQENDSEPAPETIRRLATEALDSLIDFELLFQASQAREISIQDADVEEEVGRTLEKFGSQKAFAEALKNQGINEDELRRDTRKSLAVNRMLEGDVLRDTRITEAQVEQFYTTNKEQFQHPPQTRASHILIRASQKASKQEQASAQAKAAQLLQLLRDGADFAELARAHSQDPGTNALGGDLGFFSAGEMDEAFEKAVAPLEKGQISAIVRTSYGYHIIKITDRRDAGYDAIDEVRERIRGALLKTERRRRQADFVAELRKTAKIEYPTTL